MDCKNSRILEEILYLLKQPANNSSQSYQELEILIAAKIKEMGGSNAFFKALETYQLKERLGIK